MVTIALARSVWRAKQRKFIQLDQKLFDSMLRDWTKAHGQPKGLIVRAMTRGTPAPAPRQRETDIADYSFDRAVICDRARTADVLLDGLRTGRHDLALLYSVDLPADIGALELARLRPYLLLPASHRLAGRKRLALTDLAKEPLVLLDVQPSRTYFLGVLAEAGIAPRIAFSSPSLEVVRGLVAQGLGYSILITRPDGDRSYDGGPLVAKPIARSVEPGVIVLASLRQVRKTRLVTAFEDYCVTFFAREFGKS